MSVPPPKIAVELFINFHQTGHFDCWGSKSAVEVPFFGIINFSLREGQGKDGKGRRRRRGQKGGGRRRDGESVRSGRYPYLVPVILIWYRKNIPVLD